jgi:uncharacterized protein involved in exopolysaccharide biosynthesis
MNTDNRVTENPHSSPNSNSNPEQEWDDQGEISLLDFALTFAENLKLLIFGPLCAGLVALALSFIQPNIYTAKATILPPGQDGTSAGTLLRSSLGGLGGIAGDLAGLKDPAQRYMAYLKSDTLQNTIIEKYDLKKRYEKKNLTGTRLQLRDNMSIKSDKQSGLITIDVSDLDPKFAAELANGFVAELRVFVGKLDLQEAQNRRNFLEEQIKDVATRSFLDQFSQQAIITGLVRQFEMAKVDEARVGPTFAQVDVATPPELKSAPNRASTAILTTIAAGLLLLFFVFVRQALRNMEIDPEAKDKMAQISILLKSFWNWHLGRKQRLK